LAPAAQILKRYWGYDAFRPQQKEIIDAVLAGKDTLALLPTGGGKSICYQVPALMMDGLCLVVSPLISLMQDQVARLKEAGIMAAAIYAGMHYYDVKRTLQNMLHGPFKLLYVSPERLQSDLFREYLPELDISLVAVDEAHCVSQWGHDFRPDYLRIAELRDIFRKVPVLALTASATEMVQQDICKQLKLRQPSIFSQSFERSNIYYDIRYSEYKSPTLLTLLQECGGTSIVYCRSRKQTETIARYLQQHNVAAAPYHAGLPKDKREEHQQAWMNGGVKAMIATTAFGMGIDKADVRMVVHYDAPANLEGFYQESGRAGRDGKQAYSHLLYNATDVQFLQESTALNFPPEAYLRQVYQAVVEYLQIPIGTQPDRYFDFDLQEFCSRFKLQAAPAARALKLLEQESLWTVSEAVYNPATVHFICDRQELDNVMRYHSDIAMICTALLRLYGSVLHAPATININVLAKSIKATKVYTEQQLQRLQHMELIVYNKPKAGPQMFFHHYRVDSRHLLINMQRIGVLRRQHEQRVAAVVNLLEHQQECINKQLLHYFGQQANERCGHCSTCAKASANTIDRQQLLQIISGNNYTALQVAGKYPLAIRPEVLALIRQLADEGSILLHKNGGVSVI
jgi:ATP-dependent DNA helicase RecQ